jgi:hypothetical protein
MCWGVIASKDASARNRASFPMRVSWAMYASKMQMAFSKQAYFTLGSQKLSKRCGAKEKWRSKCVTGTLFQSQPCGVARARSV